MPHDLTPLPTNPSHDLLKSQLAADLEDLIDHSGRGAPFFKPKELHQRKWQSHALATSGTRKAQEQQRFAEACLSLRLFGSAGTVIPNDGLPLGGALFCRFGPTPEAIAALLEKMSELSFFFRPTEELTSTTLADGYAGLLQPTGRLLIAGPPSFIAQLQNPVLDRERTRLAQAAAERKAEPDYRGSLGGPGAGGII
jgi:hypothetical protein